MGDVLNHCPRCSDDLPWGATTCHCGWKKRARGEGKKLAPRVPVQCAHYECPTDATIRIKTPTGWANLCPGHYDEYWGRVAREYCAGRGLNTVSECRAWIKERLAQIGARAPSRAWMDTINQAGVDVLIAMSDRKMLRELLERGVIEDDGRLIPPEQRGPRTALPAPQEGAAA